ncbi:hypothetical protein [Methylomonas albis]|uniref:Uncharacterized protein n=1 Tax=Methylomonas albis TaxID=1854563 RepID=A0ABR9D411_9GAMM|nr:hypothetical protein [Methylomonas albis]MBD9356993.1 hypothetical protein [Methylomonas albis]
MKPSFAADKSGNPKCILLNVKKLVYFKAFADASKGRYANFGSLGEPNLSQEEPIAK